MKKIIPIVLSMVVFSTVGAFAQTTTPSAATSSFEKAFASAEKPSWTPVKDLYRVDFILQGQSLIAFFDVDGELVASSRNITAAQLPISLLSSLDKHVGGNTVTSLFEVDGRDGIVYYARVNNQKSETLLKSTSYGDWAAK